MDKQIVSLEEQETIITIEYETKQLSIYTNRYVVARRIMAKGYTPVKEYKCSEGVHAVEFRVPTSEISKFLKSNIFGYSAKIQ